MEHYYFGIQGEVGHYLYKGRQHFNERYLPDDFPVSVAALDGRLLPPKLPQKQGRAELIHIGGWTILTFWDRSFDTRYGSSSTFVMEGTFDFDEAAGLAREQYPSIWNRFEFEVYPRVIQSE